VADSPNATYFLVEIFTDKTATGTLKIMNIQTKKIEKKSIHHNTAPKIKFNSKKALSVNSPNEERAVPLNTTIPILVFSPPFFRHRNVVNTPFFSILFFKRFCLNRSVLAHENT